MGRKLVKRLDKNQILIGVAILILIAFFWPKANGWESYPAVAELQGQDHYENMVCACIGIALPADDCKSCVHNIDCFGISTSCSLECNKKVNGTWQKVSCTAVATNITAQFPTDQASCESVGGIWGVFDLTDTERCILPTSDAGKICTDSSQCEGPCIANITQEQYSALIETQVPISATGYCSSWMTSAGCNAYVEDGMVNGIFCVD